MPHAEKDPALWVDNLEHCNLRLIAIGYDDCRLDQWIGILDPFDKEGNYCHGLTRCQHPGNRHTYLGKSVPLAKDII